MQRRVQTEIEQLRASNFRLNATVQELRLEMSYYQGEIKKLEWEKTIQKQEISKMSAVMKKLVSDLKSSTSRSIVDDPEYLTTVVKYPCRHIGDVIQLCEERFLLTSCEPPFFVEHANKAWSQECGWEPHEIVGLTCAFLQGERTDISTATILSKDVKETGYGRIRIHNYRKNGELFAGTVTVFPVFDTVTPTGPGSDEPILTHFAVILSDVITLASTSDDQGTDSSGFVTDSARHFNAPAACSSSSSYGQSWTLEVPDCVKQDSSQDIFAFKGGGIIIEEECGRDSSDGGKRTVSRGERDGISESNGESRSSKKFKRSSSPCSISTSFSCSSTDAAGREACSSPSSSSSRTTTARAQTAPQKGLKDLSSKKDCTRKRGEFEVTSNGQIYDRRQRSSRKLSNCNINPNNFVSFMRGVRLSDLIRLICDCRYSLALTDVKGHILITNKIWAETCGYRISEVEGRTCSILQGPLTDMREVARCSALTQQGLAAEMTVVNYRANQTAFYNHVMIVPVFGGFENGAVTHFCAMLEVVSGNSERLSKKGPCEKAAAGAFDSMTSGAVGVVPEEYSGLGALASVAAYADRAHGEPGRDGDPGAQRDSYEA